MAKVGASGAPNLASMSRSLPRVSVVLNTYNRAALVGRAVRSVLSQSGVDLELVVVDDGSTDETAAVLADIADARLRCVWQSNRGLSASRNAGAREARGEWLIFLDDDDSLCEGALAALLAPTTDPSCQVVIGGVRIVDEYGLVLQQQVPKSLSDALAGTFLIRRTLFDEAGGYLEGMPCSHQTELFLRVRHVLGDGTASYVATPVVEVERRPAAGRPLRSPANAYFGGRWLAARHVDQYTGRRERANIETIVAVNAMRIGRATDARRRLASAIRDDPLSPVRYLRLGASLVSPVGRRIWLRQWDTAPMTACPLDRVRRLPDVQDPTCWLPLERDPSPGPDSLFLPWRYRQNLVRSQCLTENDPRSQAPIYKLAARLARAKRLAPVVDIGCGSGENLVRYIGRVTDNIIGFDEPGVISLARQSFPERLWIESDLDGEALWDQVATLHPRLVVCSNLVEHVLDPRRLLSGIRHAVSDGGLALVSTPDRSRLGPDAAMGPPTDPRHIREWSAEEFSLLLESCGFEIVRSARRRRASVGFLVRATCMATRAHPLRRALINEANSAPRTSQV